ncbi:MAG: L-threonine 3-dehydrogenase, partial [Planctomycetota bacterium]|nr:L-threonine 3-dehydrogenase [Planctomycetota bacterium]
MTVMLQSGLDISGVITHRLDWSQYEEGFGAMQSGECGKVVLDWASVN